MGFLQARADGGEISLVLVLLASTLGIAVVTDVRSRRIPNWLTFSSIGAALLVHALHSGSRGLIFGISGVAVGVAVLVIPYLMGGLGAGDAKLMGAVGGFLGPHCGFVAFLFTALFGGVYAMILLGFQGAIGKTINRYWKMLRLLCLRTPLYLPPQEEESGPKLRYGIAIAAGTFSALLFAERIFPGQDCLTF